MAPLQVQVPMCVTSSNKGLAGKCPAKKEGEQDAHLRKLFWKTTTCSFYAQGCCRKGADCSYAHGEGELRTRPDRTKTALCRNWLQKTCRYSAAECKFAHGFAELNDMPPEATSRKAPAPAEAARPAPKEAVRPVPAQKAPPQMPQGGGGQLLSAKRFDSTGSAGSGAKTDGVCGECAPAHGQAEVPPNFLPFMLLQMMPMPVPAPAQAAPQETPKCTAGASDPQMAGALTRQAFDLSKTLITALLEAAKPDHYED